MMAMRMAMVMGKRRASYDDQWNSNDFGGQVIGGGINIHHLDII